MAWESCRGHCVPLLPPGCSAQPGRGPGGIRALGMAQLLAENRVPPDALILGGWTYPEVHECFRQQADQRLLEHTKGTLRAQTADLEHPTLGGGVSTMTPAPRLSPGLHGASSVWKPVRDCRA